MHRRSGYVQNYIDGHNMSPLVEHIVHYNDFMKNYDTRLYVARQWNERSESEETDLLATPDVEGLAFNMFRSDNPGPLARDNWVIGPNTDD